MNILLKCIIWKYYSNYIIIIYNCIICLHYFIILNMLYSTILPYWFCQIYTCLYLLYIKWSPGHTVFLSLVKRQSPALASSSLLVEPYSKSPSHMFLVITIIILYVCFSIVFPIGGNVRNLYQSAEKIRSWEWTHWHKFLMFPPKTDSITSKMNHV